MTREAYPVARLALELEGQPATERRIWAVLVTARAETGYGTGWHSPPHGPEAPQSRNWGAVQKTGVPAIWLDTTERPTEPAPASPNPGEWFYALDYNPFHERTDGGRGSWFWGAYRAYPSDLDAARDVVRQLAKREALDAAEEEGTTEALARASYGYYTGATTDAESAIRTRAEQLWEQAQAIAQRLGVAPVLVLDDTAPTFPGPAGPLETDEREGEGVILFVLAAAALATAGAVEWNRRKRPRKPR